MDPFLSSCGADGPLRLDVTGPGPRQSVRCVFEQPCVMVGRDGGNDLRLDHENVSRRHAYLQLLGGRLFCVDLGSRTGLWWDRRTRPAGWLDAPVHVGPYRLQLPDRPAAGPEFGLDWNPLETPAADQRILPRVTLEVFDGGRSTRHALDRVLTLAGRSAACRLQVPNFSLSRHHCSLLLTAAGVWVIDLLSREGSFVNGQRVKWACLRPGDRLQLGKVLLLPYYEGEVPESPAVVAPAADPERSAAAPGSDPDLTALAERPDEPDGPAVRTMVGAGSAPLPLATPVFDLKALEAAGPQGALLIPVLQQFNLMQQQMMDQFQQSMQMMVQVFATMHRDAMATLQKELDQIHAITRELNELQAELLASRAGNAAPPNGSAGRPAPGRPPLAHHARPDAPARPTLPPPAPDSRPAANASARAPARPAKGVPNPSDMHDWLNQRIRTLQRERESRWHKIFGFVLGK
jgi:pSer/pThr/pTyr-binding forkhead associated (FHA) protein